MFSIDKVKVGVNCFLLEIGKSEAVSENYPEETEINFPSSPDPRSDKKPFIDVLYPFAATTKPFAGGQVQQTLLMQIDIVGESGEGTQVVDDIAGEIIGKFRRGAKAGIATVTGAPTTNTTVQTATEYRVSMTIPLSFVINYDKA